VAYGEDLQLAYMRMETVEHFAKIALVTHMLGKQQLLSNEEVEKLAACREKYVTAISDNQRNGNGRQRNGNGRTSANLARKRG